MRHPVKKIVVALSVVIPSIFATSIAFAAWTANGTGSAGAQAKSAQSVAVAAGTTSAQLAPGSSGDLVLVVTNPNSYPVSITQIASGAVASITSTGGASCSGTATGLSFATGFPKTVSQVIAGSGGTFTYTITNAVAMSNSSDPSCAGVTFTIPVSVTGSSAAGSTPTSPTNATITLP